MIDSISALLTRYNPWLAESDRQASIIGERLPDPHVPRRIETPLGTKRVLLVIGPRQAGKSTLLLNLARRTPRPLVVINAEEPAFRDRCRSPAAFLDWLEREVIDQPAFLLFEEVQHLEQAGLFLKGLVDLRTPHFVAATGSASYHLMSRTRESLAGRAHRITLLPFSHAELMATRDTPTPFSRSTVAREIWLRQLRYGGYPDVWLSQSPELELARLLEAFIIRDASDLFRVTNLDAFRTLLRLIAADTGSLINLSSWAEESGVARDTAVRYLELMEEAHLVRQLRPFLGGRRAEIKAARKLYYLDCGLRNAIFGGFENADNRADGGALAETFVLAELAKHVGLLDSIQYWRTRNGAEVDFVVRRGASLVGIEVKLGDLKRPKIPRGVREFVKAYQPDRMLIVNSSLTTEVTVEGVSVKFCNPWHVVPNIII